MSIREVIAVINQMEKDRVIERYAIGRAVGATFYLEPVATLDVDVFMAFDVVPGQLIVTPKPGAIDAERFQEIVQRHNLIDAWSRFEQPFLF